ncbi:MAG: dUTP diphosphatase [Anaerolineae bacterium]|nr:dUTP diphosphatase [Anaerolineae bacterium]
MKIKPLHSNFICPTKGTQQAGAFDLYMPEAGELTATKQFIPLGFAAEVPEEHVALILPRSGAGAKFSVELNNTCGVIDSDYRGEWVAALRTKDASSFTWEAGDRVLQFLIVPVANVQLEVVAELGNTPRNIGGFGSTGR